MIRPGVVIKRNSPTRRSDDDTAGESLVIHEQPLSEHHDQRRQQPTSDIGELWRPSSDGQVPRGPESVLIARGLIQPSDLEDARDMCRQKTQLTVMQALVESGCIKSETALSATAEYFRLPFERIDGEAVDKAAFALLPLEFIRNRQIAPVRIEDDEVVVAISDPANIFLIDEVKRRLRHPVKLVVSPSQDITSLAEQFAPPPAENIDRIIADIGDEDVEVLQEEDQQVNDLEKAAGESPVIRYVNFLITDAVRQGASDIHIEPGDRRMKVRYRIDGILFEQEAAPWRLHPAIISRLKIMSNLDISERRLPQDGRIRATVRGRQVDLRVSILPLNHGEKCVIRILDNRSIQVGLDQLGMADHTYKKFSSRIHEPHGIVIVTGPTGSGKTTTLYSSLRTMDGQKMNISTVEDPVEYQLDFCNQVNVIEKIGMNFPAALKSLLRQDPDIIMIGEIRDGDTAHIAVQAALTGHLVLSTLHTNDAPSSITRMINIGIEPYLIAASVNAVLAQRLVRRICPNCRRVSEKKYDQRMLDAYELDASSIFEGAGCSKCRQTGYSGRVGVYELLDIDEKMRDIVTAGPTLSEMRRYCRESGMISMRGDGMDKVAAGLTTVEEVFRVTESEDLPQ